MLNKNLFLLASTLLLAGAASAQQPGYYPYGYGYGYPQAGDPNYVLVSDPDGSNWHYALASSAQSLDKLPPPDEAETDTDWRKGYVIFNFHAPAGTRFKINGTEAYVNQPLTHSASFDRNSTSQFKICAYWYESFGENHICDHGRYAPGTTIDWYIVDPTRTPQKYKVRGRGVMGARNNYVVGAGDYTHSDEHYYNYQGTDMRAGTWERVDFGRANLEGANLEKTACAGSDFSSARLRNISATEGLFGNSKFIATDMTGGHFTGAHLKDSDLQVANATGANFERADMANTNLGHANFEKANLREVKLNGARLQGANFKDADLSSADLSGADLTDSDLLPAKLDGAKLTGARINRATKLPGNLLPKFSHAERRGFVVGGEIARYSPPPSGVYDFEETLDGLLCKHYRLEAIDAKGIVDDYSLHLECTGEDAGKLAHIDVLCTRLESACETANDSSLTEFESYASGNNSSITIRADKKSASGKLYVKPKEPEKKPDPIPPAEGTAGGTTETGEAPPPGMSVTPVAENVVSVEGSTKPKGATGFWIDGDRKVHWVFGKQ